MIRARLIALREKRAALVARAQGERDRLAGYVDRVDTALQWAERGREWVAELRRRPLLIAAAIAVLLVVRPRRVLRLAASGLWMWRLYRGIRPFISSALAAFAAARQRTA